MYWLHALVMVGARKRKVGKHSGSLTIQCIYPYKGFEHPGTKSPMVRFDHVLESATEIGFDHPNCVDIYIDNDAAMKLAKNL
jgi:hypothetical protein